MFRSALDISRPAGAGVTVRHARPGDERALARLAALDSAPLIHGPALVAEADARLVAALPLGSGRPIADPFEPTAAHVALLELRRRQLGAAGGASRRRGLRRVLRLRTA
jgi:hypothetical protein